MKTAFIGLDYIVDISHPSGKIAASAQQVIEREVIGHANAILEHAKASQWLNILVKVGFQPGYHEAAAWSPMFGAAAQHGALALAAAGTAFHPELRASLADFTLVKPRVSAFYATPLEAILRAQDVKRLVVAGVSTAWAVQSLVRDAHDRDYRVVVVEDACAAATPAEHESSVALLQRIAQVVRVKDLAALG